MVYPSEEFIYRSSDDYYLSIRIPTNTHDKAIVNEVGVSSCPFLNELMRQRKK